MTTLTIDDVFDVQPRVDDRVEFDPYLIHALQVTGTQRRLAEMRAETPRLPTLTAITVLCDIVDAIRRRWADEA